MPIVPIRADNAYFGISKQVSQGTPVAPSTFPRWLDGTKFEYDMKVQDVWEGDGSRRLSQVFKKVQFVKGTIVFNPRPIELGFFENAAMGVAADAAVAPTASTTVSTTTVVGATTLSVAGNTGLTGTGTIILNVSPGTTAEEIVTFTLPATGTGPYVLTVAAAGTMKNVHTSADAVRSFALHTITDQYDVPYYTVEFGLGSLSGGAGQSIRVTDAKVETISRMSKAGELLSYKVEFVGISSVATTPATVVLENHSPFIYSQTYGGWTLNGSTTGDATAVQSFSIDQKNNIDTSIQAEQLILGALISGNLDITVKAEIIMQNYQLMALTYWGSTAGTTDAQAIGAGNLIVRFVQADGYHQVTYTLTTIHYEKITEPEPKKDGKHFKLGIQGTTVSNQGANTFLMSVAVQNSQVAAY
ncbi:MAG: hypothetical protein NVS4B1_33470 [Ktedonobacteraceae bacterium]